MVTYKTHEGDLGHEKWLHERDLSSGSTGALQIRCTLAHGTSHLYVIYTASGLRRKSTSSWPVHVRQTTLRPPFYGKYRACTAYHSVWRFPPKRRTTKIAGYWLDRLTWISGAQYIYDMCMCCTLRRACADLYHICARVGFAVNLITIHFLYSTSLPYITSGMVSP